MKTKKTERQDAFDDYTGPNPNELHITLPRCPHCQEPINQTSVFFGMDCVNHCEERAYEKHMNAAIEEQSALAQFFSKLSPNSDQNDVDRAMGEMMAGLDFHEMPCDDDKDSTLDKC